MVDGCDRNAVRVRLFAQPLDWHTAVQVMSSNPSAAFRKALKLWLLGIAVPDPRFAPPGILPDRRKARAMPQIPSPTATGAHSAQRTTQDAPALSNGTGPRPLKAGSK